MPGVILWGVGESTFAMMVFCIPAVPKIFSGKEVGFVSRISKSLKSWTRMMSGSSRTGSKTSSTSQQTWLHPGTHKSYSKMAKNGDSETALVDIDNRKVQRPPQSANDERITRTTELVIMEDAISENGIMAARRQAQSQQHLWMTDRV